MKPLLFVSTASGYGGAERSAELLLARIQRKCPVVVMAQNPIHVAALRAILQPPSRLIETADQTGRRSHWSKSAIFAAAYLRHRPWAAVANTHDSARHVAAAAPLLPGVARRTFLYIRDFQWTDLGGLFSRLPSARVLIPSPAVLDKPGYLAPHLRPAGPMAWSISPDLVEIPNLPPSPDLGSGVLHLATVNPFKGHLALIGAAARLRAAGRPVRIVSRGINGGEELRRQLVQTIAGLGLGEVFDLGPYVADPAPLLAGCRCVVVPSTSHDPGPETFGRSVIEAWSYRKPVAAFAVGGPKYLIEHEKDGLLVPEGDEAGLADALDRLNRDDNLCRRLGEAGHAKVCRNYEIDRGTEAFLAQLGRPA